MEEHLVFIWSMAFAAIIVNLVSKLSHAVVSTIIPLAAKKTSSINFLPLVIKRLRERAPPYVLTNVEPSVGHQVLTDRVHITELGSRTNPR